VEVGHELEERDRRLLLKKSGEAVKILHTKKQCTIETLYKLLSIQTDDLLLVPTLAQISVSIHNQIPSTPLITNCKIQYRNLLCQMNFQHKKIKDD